MDVLRYRDTWIAAPVQLVVFSLIAAFRLVDGDEGYYLIASMRVLEGAVPYRDFFYPQMGVCNSLKSTANSVPRRRAA